MQKPITEIIHQRLSTRTYAEQPISPAQQQSLRDFLSTHNRGPFGTRIRFELLAASEGDAEALRGLGTYGLIKNPGGFIAGAVERGPKDLEDYGYAMEHAILLATDLGLGTCWLGGAFRKSRFAKKIALQKNETTPAVVAIGNVKTGDPVVDKIRQRVRGSARFEPEKLFFDGQFGTPLPLEQAGVYAPVLNAVRWAPSASNKQPWRIVRSGETYHLYLARTPGYGKSNPLVFLMRLADMQRVDMGIAMCHFALTAAEAGLGGTWTLDNAHVAPPAKGTEYIASWKPNAA